MIVSCYSPVGNWFCRGEWTIPKLTNTIDLSEGDGDFYDSLNLVKNVLRKDVWVIGTSFHSSCIDSSAITDTLAGFD